MSWLDADEEPQGWDAWDESAARVRPNPKGNRPRSKQRPSHEDAVAGFVIGVDRGVGADELRGAGAELVVGDLEELVAP